MRQAQDGFLKSVFTAVLVLTMFGAFAQTDVTNTYLVNANFDSNPHYTFDAAASNLGSANAGANIHTIDSWIIGTIGDNSAASTYEYGFAGYLNQSGTTGTIPAAGPNGETGSGHSTLGISVAWSATVTYYQSVTLPAGSYTLTYDYYNSGPSAVDNGRAGWVPDSGTPVLSALTSFTQNVWKKDAITFVLTQETTGKIQVGLNANNAGSGGHGRIFFDNMKIERSELPASLSAMSADLGVLSPAFDAYTYDYKLFVPANTTSVTVSTTPGSGFSVSETGATSGVISLNDTNQTATFEVSGSGYTTKTYSVTAVPLSVKHAYTFDGNTNDSQGTLHGTQVGGSISNGAFISSTTTDGVTFDGAELALKDYDGITLEAYVTSSTANTGYHMLTYFGNTSGDGSYWIQPARADNVSQNEFWGSAIKGVEIADNGFHHFVSTLRNDEMVFYIDGALVGKIDPAHNISEIKTNLAYLCKSGWPDNSWQGQIHEFNIYNGVMDAATVSANHGAFKIDQSITFETIPAKVIGAADFNLTASASSGLAVTFTSSNPEVATVSGNTVTIVGTGSTDITASQAGDATYKAATDVVQKLNVTAISTDATLSGLIISNGILSPAFSSGTKTYSAILSVGTTSVDVTATANDSGASVKINSSSTTTTTVTIANQTGLATIDITAADGTTTDQYTIKFEVNDNYALYLPGVDGNNSNVNISGLNITALPYTMEMWIKEDGVQTNNAGLIFNRPGNLGFQVASSWQANSQGIRFLASGGDQYGSPTLTPNVTTNEWHHLAVVMTDTDRIVYYDGVASTEKATFAVNDFSTGTTYLGWDSDVANRAFKGWIDEVRVWNVARTADQLTTTKYDTIEISSASGLVGYWNFDDPKEGLAKDKSASGLHAVIKGGTYTVSDIFGSMTYVSSDASQQEKLVGTNTKQNIAMVLAIETQNEVNPLSLTKINLLATGTDLNDLTNIAIYATRESAFSNTNLVAELKNSPATAEFSIDANYELVKGFNFFWITVDVASNAAKGHIIDFEIKDFTLSGTQHVPATTSPVGSLSINPDAFISYIALPTDTVSITAHSSVEGSNFASFQQNAIQTFNGYQYVTYWNNVGGISHPVIGRKKLPDGEWEDLILSYAVAASKVNDNHQTISMGICANDGTIHIAYDHHDVPLNYQKSVVGMATDPENADWSNASFNTKQSYLVPGAVITPVTYPRFISKPNGDLLYECRLGQSGNGDSYLWEYSGSTHDWVSIGKYILGTNISQNAYINGVHYDPSGRMHVSWVWRETPDPQTNHDVYYGYSDDDGRTWFNAAGTHIATAVSNPMTLSTAGLKVVTVGKNRGLINQESQAVDNKGKIHILQSYISDDHPNSNNFWDFRINYGDLRHIYQDSLGIWQSDIVARSARNRSEIAVDGQDNVYIVSGDHRIYFASAADGWKNWSEFDISKAGISQNEGFVDRDRLLQEGILSYLYAPASNDNKVFISNYQLPIKSSNAFLSNILIDGKALEGFSSGVFEYQIEVPRNMEAPTVKGVPSHQNAEVEELVILTIPPISEIDIRVTSEDGKNSQTYHVRFVYVESTDASLSDLKLDGVSIDGFNKDSLNYIYEIPFGSTIPAVSVTTADTAATVKIKYAFDPISTTIEVTAEDGSTMMSYKIVFVEVKSDDVSLKAIQINGEEINGFDVNKITYDVELHSNDLPVISVETNDPNATVSITQASETPGSAAFVVTAQDGETFQTYTINFTVKVILENGWTTGLAVYPNPATDRINISSVDQLVTVEILDLSGKVISAVDVKSSQISIPVHSLKRGIYLLKLKLVNDQMTLKRIVLE